MKAMASAYVMEWALVLLPGYVEPIGEQGNAEQDNKREGHGYRALKAATMPMPAMAATTRKTRNSVISPHPMPNHSPAGCLLVTEA